MALAAALIGAAAGAQPDARRADPCAPAAQLYIAPMGTVFRAAAGAAYPSAAWLAAADADRDGRLSAAEFIADAAAAFGRFDTDRDGEIAPAEITAYETGTAPEIALYQRGRPMPGRRLSGAERRRAAEEAGLQGAGRWAQLNIPHPLASADLDFNRGVSRDEWRVAAERRFRQLEPVAGMLTEAGLKPTPAQAARAACAAAAAKKAGRR